MSRGPPRDVPEPVATLRFLEKPGSDEELAAGLLATTSTTTAYCFEDTVSWEPLDMDGTLPSKEEGPEDCQKKCFKTNGCYHFSYWRKFKLCHLQDAFALRRDYQSNFISGPFRCWSYLQDAGLVKVGVEQFLPKQFNCMQVGVSWEPVMQWRSGQVLAGGQADQILGCQALCAKTPMCTHFTMDVGMHQCKLAGADAAPLPGVFHTISGPTACDEKTSQRTFMRKFEHEEEEE